MTEDSAPSPLGRPDPGRVDIRVAPGAVERVRALNGRLITAGVVAAAVGLLITVIVLASGNARITLLIVIGILIAVIGLLYLPKMIGLRRRLAVVAAADGLVLSVTERGVEFPHIPLIPWSEMIGVIFFDDRTRESKRPRLPIMGRSGDLVLRAGDGTRMLLIAVRDGIALRATVQPVAAAGLVRLWGSTADRVRPGDYWVTLDSVLDQPTVDHAVAAVRLGANHSGIPVFDETGTLDFLTTLGKLMEPEKWTG